MGSLPPVLWLRYFGGNLVPFDMSAACPSMYGTGASEGHPPTSGRQVTTNVPFYLYFCCCYRSFLRKLRLRRACSSSPCSSSPWPGPKGCCSCWRAETRGHGGVGGCSKMGGLNPCAAMPEHNMDGWVETKTGWAWP